MIPGMFFRGPVQGRGCNMMPPMPGQKPQGMPGMPMQGRGCMMMPFAPQQDVNDDDDDDDEEDDEE